MSNKIRMIVLENLSAEDVLTLQKKGFFDNTTGVALPAGVTGQVATLSRPPAQETQAPTAAAHDPDFGPPPTYSTPPGPPEFLTPHEAEAWGGYTRVAPDVLAAYTDGSAGVSRVSVGTEEQIERLWKGYSLFKSGKAGEAAVRKRLDTDVFATKAAPKAEVVSGGGGPKYHDPEFIALLNSRKYVREMVNDFIEIGISTRSGIVTACTQIADQVPAIQALGNNLTSRIDQSFAAIGL